MVALAVSQSIATLEWLNSGHFSPATLFATSEPGVWYDPSDVANTNWLYNLFTFTDQFDNAAWTATNVTVTSNVTTAPDGTLTADKIVQSAGTRALNQDGPKVSIALSVDRTISVSAKQDTARYLAIGFSNNAGITATAVFDLQNGTVSGSGLHPNGASSLNTSIEPQGNGWYRCSIGLVGVGSASMPTCHIASSVDPANGLYSRNITGDGTSGIYIWGAQLQTGSTATTYQPITTVDAGTIARFPQATLYQDSAGTTPVTAPAQPVGLMLDKKNGLVLGSELRGTGAIGITGTATAATYNTSTGAATAFRVDATNQSFVSISGLASSSTYIVSVTCISAVVGIAIRAGAFSAAQTATLTAGQTRTVHCTGATSITFTDSGGGSSFIVNSVKELPGTHATQSTSASRPTYGIVPATGRRNLLTFSEQFDNAAWTLVGATISANISTAPDGTTTADKLVENTANSQHAVVVASASRPTIASGNHTHTVYVKADGRTSVALYNNGTSGGAGVSFNLTDGTVIQTGGSQYVSNTITAVGSGWYRIGLTFLSLGGTAALTVYLGSTFAGDTYTGNGTSGVLVWGAQLETGSTATAYQRVVTAFEVTEANVASLSYLSFDGIDDFMVTPTISPDTATSDGAARRNLLTFPSAFNDAAWGLLTATVSANAGEAPDGTTTADKIRPDNAAALGSSGVSQTVTTAAATYTYSAHAKAVEFNRVVLAVRDNASASNSASVTVSLVDGAITTAAASAGTFTGASATVTSVGSGYYRVALTFTSTGATSIRGRVFADDSVSTTGNGTSGILVWGAQLELGSTATAFQDIGTDKVQVFTGVRKLSDANTAAVIEHSANYASNNGTLALFAPAVGTLPRYDFYTKGTSAAFAVTSSSYPAPITNVVTGLGDISGDIATLRVNGSLIQTVSTDQGTGNYLAYPMYIGRRGGTSLPFNGQMYGLITRFGTNLNTSQLVSTEGWMNTKTRAY